VSTENKTPLPAAVFSQAFALGPDKGEAKVGEYATLIAAPQEVRDSLIASFRESYRGEIIRLAASKLEGKLKAFSLPKSLVSHVREAFDLGLLTKLHFVEIGTASPDTGEPEGFRLSLASPVDTSKRDMSYMYTFDGEKLEAPLARHIRENFPESKTALALAKAKEQRELYKSTNGTEGSKTNLSAWETVRSDPDLRSRYHKVAK